MNKIYKILVLSLMCVSLVACSKKGICEQCEKETTIYHFKSTIDLESIGMDSIETDKWFCENCCEDNAAVLDAFNKECKAGGMKELATYSY